MATTAATQVPKPNRLRNALLTRQLDHYPKPAARYFYLAIVVLTTMMLYYLYYVEGAVVPLLLPYYHMSFQYFLYLLVVSNAVGAFTAFIGGLSDKIGRANLTIIGTFVVGIVQLVGVPNIHSKFGFALAYVVIGFVEGIILVSTPALIRDFSPQLGRASAMGFWALGPVVGSLVAAVVANHTLPHLAPWQDQFVISGVACMVVVALAVVGLRELAPRIRNQLMVSETERVLVEARALGVDVEAATAHPLRSMLRLDLISSSVAVAVFLLIYYVSVSVLTVYWVVVFNRTAANANGINTWYWTADAVTLIVVGVVSDRLRVRKPFMVIGAAGTIVMTLVLISQTGHGTTTCVLLQRRLGGVARDLHRHRLHALDGGVHRSGRGAQSRARGHRSRGLGLDTSGRCRDLLSGAAACHHDGHDAHRPLRRRYRAPDVPDGSALRSVTFAGGETPCAGAGECHHVSSMQSTNRVPPHLPTYFRTFPRPIRAASANCRRSRPSSPTSPRPPRMLRLHRPRPRAFSPSCARPGRRDPRRSRLCSPHTRKPTTR